MVACGRWRVRVAGIVLAAGRSTRMGRNKLLLRLGGESLVRKSARVALEAGLAPVVVVLGHEADEVGAELAGLPCRTVLNPEHGHGMNASIDAGIGALPPEADAAVVILADMPLVTAAMVRALVDRHRAAQASLVASRYGGVVAPPALYARAVFGELRGGLGEGRGREVLQRHRGEVEWVDWPAEALADVDEPADLQRAPWLGAERP
jgi:molybdenum cofactor cytidylyltransferase